MDKINAIDSKRIYKTFTKDKVADLNKTNYNNKKISNKDIRFSKDRGDSYQLNSKEKIESKIQNLNSRLPHFSLPSKIEKRDANTQDTEKKRDNDKNSKTKNLLDRRYETKSRNIFDIKDELNKDHSKARVDVKNISRESKPNVKMDNTSHPANKRPLIKTITDTNDATKTYKAVTFTERKPQKAIKIKIPVVNNVRKTNIPKLINRHQRNKMDTRNNFDENVNSKRNSKFDKKIKHRREIVSPIRERYGVSPPTEIAKWAPNTITDHTRPYYEAWINTTLSAICNKKDETYLEKKKIWKTFQKSLEDGSFSPDLIYENFTDERFTGRIRVNHR
ncbi:uncharacterized protein LOC124542096 [Vanessa cardui]|uniref:uncharacterized protein LOC124542096 n=1 Tax=Vanessa cardui TaxID=171605 RepID=UPI001F133B43|nr:uncharacterized protein LOC124542096 [Vanessa cardui]